jgi:CxxC motif-containing protein (DUF1111 family)
MFFAHRAAFRGLVVLFFANCLLDPSLLRAADKPEPITGRDLFQRKWTANDPLSPDGDGLGPCFNAVSCATCHEQGGLGGGGGNQHNVDLLTIEESPQEVRHQVNERRQKPGRWHPNFLRQQSTIILHHFGVYSDYEAYRFGLLGIEYSPDMTTAERAQFWASQAKRQRNRDAVESFQVDGLKFQLSHRSTPALFGAGRIDAIPAEAIQKMERQQQVGPGERSDISGRTAIANPARRHPFDAHAGEGFETVGRFGWRGQTATLADFVLGACANELGLQTRRHAQAMNPLAPTEPDNSIDLNENDCEKLIEFVRDLPRPRQVKPRDPKLLREVSRGEELFGSIGCATCHVEKVGEVDGLYSDLLLHDMGEELSDPVPAAPLKVLIGKETLQVGYFGGVRVIDVLAEIPTEIQREWRTPPLWGVADSPPYLHDGRAETLQQAILLHGGEGTTSRQRFVILAPNDKSSLISFLKTLRAPR